MRSKRFWPFFKVLNYDYFASWESVCRQNCKKLKIIYTFCLVDVLSTVWNGPFHGHSVEFPLCFDDFIKFACSDDANKAGMVIGLQLFDFNFYPVVLRDCLLGSLFRVGIHPSVLPHLFIEGTLFSGHFPIQRKEGCSL